MKISEIVKNRPTLSFEVFPPRPEADADLSGIRRTLADLRVARPDFVSVTYGAGGQNRPRALEIAGLVLSLGMSPLSHLTAVGYTKQDSARVLDSLKRLGVDNILALRGDIPKEATETADHWKDYKKACDLVEHTAGLGEFCIGGAAYPEGHQESVSPQADIEYMREKVDAGVSFFITQLFFDNAVFYEFMDRLRGTGLDVPVIVGIMPVFRAPQISRIVEISGCKVPGKLSALLERHMDDDAGMREAGIDYAVEQIDDLRRNGVHGIHIYTMNKSRGVLEILKRCGLSGRGGDIDLQQARLDAMEKVG